MDSTKRYPPRIHGIHALLAQLVTWQDQHFANVGNEVALIFVQSAGHYYPPISMFVDLRSLMGSQCANSLSGHPWLFGPCKSFKFHLVKHGEISHVGLEQDTRTVEMRTHSLASIVSLAPDFRADRKCQCRDGWILHSGNSSCHKPLIHAVLRPQVRQSPAFHDEAQSYTRNVWKEERCDPGKSGKLISHVRPS